MEHTKPNSILVKKLSEDLGVTEIVASISIKRNYNI